MVELTNSGVYVFNSREILEDTPDNRVELQQRLSREGSEPRSGTIAYSILASHNQSGDMENLQLKFDALASHDITYVNIIQTAKVSGVDAFPLPYILTNCHNSLCAVGGTINGDDHRFGLSAAKHYGGIFVPPHLGVIHSYIRETHSGCGRMILGSDSHTRYGSLGTMGIGEGGGELVKQLLSQTYDIPYPRIVGVYLSGKVRQGVGPHDVSLALTKAVFDNGFVKNSVLEFFGPGIAALSADFRYGIDVMTTETACLSSIWETDAVVRDFLETHGRLDEYRELKARPVAYYDALIRIDLSTIKPMIALPFHPSNAFEIDALLANPVDILRAVEQDGMALIGEENPGLQFDLTSKVDAQGKIRIDQGIIGGCAGGTFENIMTAAAILSAQQSMDAPGAYPGDSPFSLSIYPGSQPILLALTKKGAIQQLISQGAVIRTAFCGPCFGAGDVPPNNGLSIRHSTRNFPNREGSRPGDGQIASVCLMDARSIAATALNGGYLSSAENLGIPDYAGQYSFDAAPYTARVYQGVGRPQRDIPVEYGPNIVDWPPMSDLGEDLLVKIVSFITDPVTTTDELIPSGETSSYRSNPIGLAEFTLSRKDKDYVGRAKAVRQAEIEREALAAGEIPAGAAFPALADLREFPDVLARSAGLASKSGGDFFRNLRIGSAIFARKPGDGSAREQAASCQKVLGGWANFALEYATKRYRSNCINWGIIPFTLEGFPVFNNGDYVFIPGILSAIRKKDTTVAAYCLRGTECIPFALPVPVFSDSEADLVIAGSLINYNRKNR